MKLYNVIITYDGYVVAGDDESAIKSAREAMIELIQANEYHPAYSAALPVANTPVQPRCQLERPIVAADVSDADFAKVKGKTNQQVWELLTKKQRG